MILSGLGVIEAAYLLISIVVVFSRLFQYDPVMSFTELWIILSYMVLPVLLLKNILVGVLENKILKQNEKMWLIVRCALYIFLTFYSYPLIQAVTAATYCS